MAPLGYLNVRDKIDGREIRTIAVDPERAPLIRWAFEAYATGDYSLTQLLTAVTAKGLQTLPTRKRPAHDLYLSKFAEMLHNPYYMGVVTYRGVRYDGRHEPLITPALFEKVQEVLKQHLLAGDRSQKHNHYLKGTITCGECGGRLLFARARGRWGGLYDYFFCQRRAKSKTCKQPYLLVSDVEEAICRYYGVVAFAPKTLDAIRKVIFEYFDRETKRRKHDATRLASRLTTLKQESRKLIQLGLSDSIPEEIFREEQLRIRGEITRAESELQVSQGKIGEVKSTVDKAMVLLERCADAYKQAPGTLRRQWNQSIFEQLRVFADKTIVGELKPPFSHIINLDLERRYRREKTPIATLKKEYDATFWRDPQVPALVFSGRGSHYEPLVALAGTYSNRQLGQNLRSLRAKARQNRDSV